MARVSLQFILISEKLAKEVRRRKLEITVTELSKNFQANIYFLI